MATTITSLFKKPTPPAVGVSHRAALREHLRAITPARVKLDAVNAKDAQAAADVASLDAIEQQMHTLQASIDDMTASAEYEGRPLVADILTAQRRKLAAAVETHKSLMARARTASIIRHKFAADRLAINAELQGYDRDSTRLLWLALQEHLASLAEEFREKEEAFREIHARVFAVAFACDEIAEKQLKNGQYVRSRNYEDTQIGRPETEPFRRYHAMPEAAQAQYMAEYDAVLKAANALPNEFLNELLDA